jgi:hypothetical protein
MIRSAWANRQEYLARTLRVLQSGTVDGVLATMDIIEDCSLSTI